MAEKGRGFALGSGDPSSPISILFERPAEDEIIYLLDTTRKPDGMSPETWKHVKAWREAELIRRRAAYPELENRFLLRGAPVRGASGGELTQMAFPMAGGGIHLEDCFLENVLHCAAPAGGDSYPTGAERLKAEACCTHWSRLSKESGIDVSIVSLHPAGLLREEGGGITALPLQADSFSKARSFVTEAKKVLVLAGGVAAKFWLGYAESVTKWVGHYARETEETWTRRLGRLQRGLTVSLEKKSRKRKKAADERVGENEELKPRRRKRAPKIPGMEAFGM